MVGGEVCVILRNSYVAGFGPLIPEGILGFPNYFSFCIRTPSSDLFFIITNAIIFFLQLEI